MTAIDLVDLGDGLVEARLRSPPLNELGEALLADLEAVAARLPSLRGLLLSSGLERGFSAGADLRGLAAAIASRGHAAVLADVRGFVERIGRALTALDQAPIPVVCALHGVVFGGGLELALVADLRVADRTARFAFPELRLGLVPGFGGVARLARDVGLGHVRELLLTGRSLNAEAARAAGLVGQVVAEGRARDVALRALEQAARHDPAATAAAKRLAKPPLEAALAAEREAFLELFARPAAAKALARFVERDGAEPLPYLAEPS